MGTVGVRGTDLRQILTAPFSRTEVRVKTASPRCNVVGQDRMACPWHEHEKSGSESLDHTHGLLEARGCVLERRRHEPMRLPGSLDLRALSCGRPASQRAVA